MKEHLIGVELAPIYWLCPWVVTMIGVKSMSYRYHKRAYQILGQLFRSPQVNGPVD